MSVIRDMLLQTGLVTPAHLERIDALPDEQGQAILTLIRRGMAAAAAFEMVGAANVIVQTPALVEKPKTPRKPRTTANKRQTVGKRKGAK